jgi:hypothetical protein
MIGLCILVSVAAFGQIFGRDLRQQHEQEHSRFRSEFKAGSTNAPWLAMDWFSDHGVYFCRVTRDGKVYSARDVGHAIQGGTGISSRFSLDSANRPSLQAVINRLPASAKSVPIERRILVSGIRSNQWFSYVYDRADVPSEVEQLYQLTQACLGWFIPEVQGRPVARLDRKNFTGHLAALAADAPVAISFGQSATNYAYYPPPLMDFWNTEHGLRQIAPAFRGLTSIPTRWNGVALSADGRIAVVAIESGVYAVNSHSGALLWIGEPLDHDNFFGSSLAIGEGGKTLFAAGAHVIERRDLFTGKKLGQLEKNELLVKFLKTSHTATVLLAGFGLANGSASEFALWDAGQNEPALRFSMTGGASVGLSPDGQTLVLNAWPDYELQIWRWRTGEKKAVPLRVPYGASSAYALVWSPDGKKLAAYVGSYPPSIIVYETTTWKPLAQWRCGEIGASSEFEFSTRGTLLQLQEQEINELDVAHLKGLGE